jgi:hypothetical protein
MQLPVQLRTRSGGTSDEVSVTRGRRLQPFRRRLTPRAEAERAGLTLLLALNRGEAPG